MKYLVYCLVILGLISCKNNPELKDHLGEIRINVSGKADALPHFEKGLLLLHSFEYEDARAAFQEARAQDPNMAMAYWGEAMTYNHPLWSEQDYIKAGETLKKLDTLVDETGLSKLEQDLIRAVHILYKPKTEKNARDVAYSEYMEELTKTYPGNHEVASFYALSLLGSVPEGRDVTIYGQGAEIAQGILKENPKHPGALHYLIHSYDDPDHASLALDAAHAYAKVAPDASHALHMPSHIFVAMGMWDEVIASNINSYQASLTRMKEKNLNNDARGYHAFHWLQYGYLQKGNSEKAAEMLREMEMYATETPSVRARAHLIFLKGTYLVHTNEWESDLANSVVDISDLSMSVRSQYHFMEAMKAYSRKDAVKLDSLIALTETEINRGSFIVKEGPAMLCSNAERGDITNSDIIGATARLNQMQALRASLNGDPELAETHLKQSIDLEEGLSYSFGPPFIQKPTQELYADWLVEQGRLEEAVKQYNAMLKRAPKRKLTLEGLKRAKA